MWSNKPQQCGSSEWVRHRTRHGFIHQLHVTASHHAPSLSSQSVAGIYTTGAITISGLVPRLSSHQNLDTHHWTNTIFPSSRPCYPTNHKPCPCTTEPPALPPDDSNRLFIQAVAVITHETVHRDDRPETKASTAGWTNPTTMHPHRGGPGPVLQQPGLPCL